MTDTLLGLVRPQRTLAITRLKEHEPRNPCLRHDRITDQLIRLLFRRSLTLTASVTGDILERTSYDVLLINIEDQMH